MSKSGLKMVDAKFAKLFTPPVFWYVYLPLSFYIFATNLQGANLGKCIFRPAFYLAVYFKEEK